MAWTSLRPAAGGEQGAVGVSFQVAGESKRRAVQGFGDGSDEARALIGKAFFERDAFTPSLSLQHHSGIASEKALATSEHWLATRLP